MYHRRTSIRLRNHVAVTPRLLEYDPCVSETMMNTICAYRCLSVLLLCSTLHAADGPALSQLRAKLQLPGDVLIDHEDPSTLIAAAADGSSREIVAVEPSGTMP